ncbi:MAG: SDR family NAD(P)-dependent oxidoreductase [bacterium]|nr:SDR family NAD(P)-dependent oxidoreductase [bacterium]
MKWNVSHMPEQKGRVALVTGANSGIGFETARALARKGARVFLACRNETKGTDAVDRIRSEMPDADVDLISLDLASLESVRACAAAFLDGNDRLDLLVNNAGVMVPPESKTREGLEMQIGVNYFGHFALTGLLIDTLTASPGSRVTTVSSLAHRTGKIDFDNFRGEKPYKPWREYCQSKLANLIFAIELQRRLERTGADVLSTAAHPGFTATDLQRHNSVFRIGVGLWSNTPAVGALPTLYAATAPEADPGGYYGPKGIYEAKGYPAPAKVVRRARDKRTATRLWQVGEEVTGVRFLSA